MSSDGYYCEDCGIDLKEDELKACEHCGCIFCETCLDAHVDECEDNPDVAEPDDKRNGQ